MAENPPTPSLTTKAAKEARKAEIRAFLDDPRFHQKFVLPSDALAWQGLPDPFTVTYSDFGFRDEANPANENVLVFLGPLLCSRFFPASKDRYAREHKVRILALDRPGFGGTTEVPVEGRVKAWLAILPVLLSHLFIPHVSLVCHSAGTIYTLNTLLHLRRLLHPTRPYVAFCGPWIHPSHTDSVAMNATSKLVPDGVLKRLDNVAGFFITRVVPTLGFSGNVLSGAVRLLPGTGAKEAGAENDSFLAEGVDPAEARWADELLPLVLERVYGALSKDYNVQGLGPEAMLLMKRGGGDEVWGPGAWGDYDRLVPMLAAQEEASAGAGGEKLRVDTFFAEEDMMIGTTKGPKWWDGCWAEEKRGPRIEYRSEVVAHTDHDSMTELRYGMFQRIIRMVAGEEE